jgi:Mrp family chromosome partitioning ATPase/capsular polysaccharide biosynthesis protein
MELNNFIKLLKRQKYILIAVPLFAVILTYFLVRKMPDTYTSRARIATGIVDQSQQPVLENQSNEQESKINQQFSNLIQMMQLKKVLDQVSYQLMINDLTKDTALRTPSKLLKQLPENARKHAVDVYTALYQVKAPLQISNEDQAGLKRLLESMGYDDESLKKKLVIYRVNSSDYIDIEFESDSPSFSAFVINTLSKEFINYYSDVVKQSQLRAVNFLDSIMQQKKAVMDDQIQLLKTYKIDNRVLNLNEQAKSLYAQLADFETKREMAEKDILAYTGALKSIEDKFNPQDRRYLESTLTNINQDIINTKDLLKQANETYIKSNYDAKYKARVDSLKNLLVSQINESTDKYIVNPLAAKQNLVLQKIGLEVNLDIAKFSINSLNREVKRLNEKFDKLVPHEAVIQAYEESIDFASKEYIEILKKYNQTSLESSLTIQLKQIEMALPGHLQPSKKMLLVILSGFASFVLCMVVLFVLFYLDESVKTAKELANKTNITVLGFLPLLKKTALNLNDLWKEESQQSIQFKNLLRDIRFETDCELEGSKVIAVSSIKPKEGKSIFAMSLAYAYSTVNKKVLLIDGNFTNNSITQTSNTSLFLEDYLRGNITVNHIYSNDSITVLGTKGGDITLLEISDENKIQQKLAELKFGYDIIIIEVPALAHLNKSKEWILFADKIIAVFEANQSISFAAEQQINYLKLLNKKFIGWVLNKVTDEEIKFKKPK